jgi:hypothetical protein
MQQGIDLYWKLCRIRDPSKSQALQIKRKGVGGRGARTDLNVKKQYLQRNVTQLLKKSIMKGSVEGWKKGNYFKSYGACHY